MFWLCSLYPYRRVSGCMKWWYMFQWNPRKIWIRLIQKSQSSVQTGLSKFITWLAMKLQTTHTKSAGRFECCHQASLHCSLLHSSIRQYMGIWQLHTCILFYSLVCSHSGSARSTSPQPGEVSSIVASVVVIRPWSIPRRMEMATLAPFASCPGLQAVCEINVPNKIQPLNRLNLSKNVRQENAVALVLESGWCPGEEHLNNKLHRQGSSHLLQVSGLQQCIQQCLCWSVVPLPSYKVQAQFHW